MAKVTGPLFSEEAQGRIGTTLSFRKTKVWYQATPQFHRGPARSNSLTAHRALYSAGCVAWGNLTPLEREAYADPPRAELSSFNYFMQIYLMADVILLGWILFSSATFNEEPTGAELAAGDYSATFPTAFDEFPTMVDGLHSWQAWIYNRAGDSVKSIENYILTYQENIEG